MDIPKQPWLDQARSNLTAFFEGRRRLVFQFNVADPTIFMGLSALGASKTSLCQAILDHRLDLERQLTGLRRRFELGKPDDFVYALRPYTGVGFFAAPFGCVTEFPAVGDPQTHPVIRSIEEVDRLRPNVAWADLVRLALDKIRYFLDQTGGALPIMFPDLQSPIDVATIVMDYTEFMCALTTDPVRAHRLLAMITDVILEVMGKVRELLPRMPPTTHWWLPRGIRLSDDLMAVVSPEHYRTFAMPYNNRLSDAFGGLFLHSCGNPLATVDVVREYRGLMGLDFWEVTIRDFQERGGDFPCSCPVVVDPWHNLDRRATRTRAEQTNEAALKDLIQLKHHMKSPVLFCGVCPDPAIADEFYAVLSGASRDMNFQGTSGN